MDCQYAGERRCRHEAKRTCSARHPYSENKLQDCIDKEKECCLRAEKGTCHRAIREFKYREHCDKYSEKKCFDFNGKTKCQCIVQNRQSCISKKIYQYKENIRKYYDCEDAVKILCSHKKCGSEYHECLKKERELCEPVCQRESRLLCDNQSNGPRYDIEFKKCKDNWRKDYCEKRASVVCNEDDTFCLDDEIRRCKKTFTRMHER